MAENGLIPSFSFAGTPPCLSLRAAPWAGVSSLLGSDVLTMDQTMFYFSGDIYSQYTRIALTV